MVGKGLTPMSLWALLLEGGLIIRSSLYTNTESLTQQQRGWAHIITRPYISYVNSLYHIKGQRSLHKEDSGAALLCISCPVRSGLQSILPLNLRQTYIVNSVLCQPMEGLEDEQNGNHSNKSHAEVMVEGCKENKGLQNSIP